MVITAEDMTPEQRLRWEGMVNSEGIEIEIPDWLEPQAIPTFLTIFMDDLEFNGPL